MTEARHLDLQLTAGKHEHALAGHAAAAAEAQAEQVAVSMGCAYPTTVRIDCEGPRR